MVEKFEKLDSNDNFNKRDWKEPVEKFPFPERDKDFEIQLEEFPFPEPDKDFGTQIERFPFPEIDKVFIKDLDEPRVEYFTFAFSPEDISSNLVEEKNGTQDLSNDVPKNVIPVDRVDGDPEKNKEILNNLEPNTIYVFENGDMAETDDRGRVIKVVFTPVLTEDKRTSEDNRKTSEVGKLGNEGDHGGHIQAHRLGGSSERINLFPQNGNFNTGDYKKIENGIANDLKAGNQVSVTVKLIYNDPNSVRPDKVSVTKTVTDSSGNVEVTSITKNNAPKGEQDA